MNKSYIRKTNLLLRKTLDKNVASRNIVSKINGLNFYSDAKNVLIYYPLKYEIDLLDLTLNKSKNFYLPRVEGNEIVICPFSSDLKKSEFGVLEPLSSPVDNISLIDVAFIPAIAADKNLNRIGYGKGFYDRLLVKKEFGAKKIIVIYKELMVDFICSDEFDAKADMIITD